jgi:hypothetical protein
VPRRAMTIPAHCETPFSNPPRPFRPLSRRSGRIPALPLSSAQVLPEWSNRNLAGNRFAANGDKSLNFVSHSRGSLHFPLSRLNCPLTRLAPRGGGVAPHRYLEARVTVLLCCPPMLTTMGTAVPARMPEGTSTLI